MPFVSLSGILVNFPHEPYPGQITYMQKVLDALNGKSNALLESPTGTGKTLCLLCSSLAWLTEQKSKFHQKNWDQLSNEIESKNGMRLDNNQSFEVNAKSNMRFDLPKIIYTSRTHSQLSQVIRELKKTSYANQFRIAVLGSREQLCIHNDVIKEKNSSMKIQICRNKVKNRSCQPYLQVENKKHIFNNLIGDIEDLVINGRKNNCCPYYVSRELSKDADIIFMPYNYLIDSKIRKTHSLDLNNSIVIFDEAHNLEQICEETASFSLSSFEIASIIADLDLTIKNINELAAVVTNIPDDPSNASINLTMEEAIKVKEYILKIELEIDQYKGKENMVFDGVYILDLFVKTITSFEGLKDMIETVQRCSDFLAEFLAAEIGVSNFKGKGLNQLLDILKAIDFATNYNESLESIRNTFNTTYKVYLGYENENSYFKNTSKQRVLNCWCFSSAYTMLQLTQLGIRNIILTSGTLSPFEQFSLNFGIHFDIILENTHIINSEKQVWIGVVKRGPDNVKLCCTFNERSKPEYIRSLGTATANFSKIIPKGVLIFFPSYKFMKQCLDTWNHIGTKNIIENNKPLFVEDQGKLAFETAASNFYKSIEDSRGGASCKGAMFAGVCRGKLSEGIDFADDYGRAVIITGLPFPPYLDAKVKLKMEFLDTKHKINPKGMTGRQWYTLQGTSAVNQAIGRVIRHRDDYGAILLCDERYSNYKDTLPGWLRPMVNEYNEFGKVIKDLSTFFKNANHSDISRTLSLPDDQNKRRKLDVDVEKENAKLKNEKMLSGYMVNNNEGLLSSQFSCEVISGSKQFLAALKRAERSQPSTSTAKNSIQFSNTQPSSTSTNINSLPNINKPAFPKADNTNIQSTQISHLNYLKEMKNFLCQESFLQLKESIAKYKKMYQLEVLIEEVSVIFDMHDSKAQSFIYQLVEFLPKKHREEFKKRINNIIESTQPTQL